jgi:transposase-like protein
MNQCQCTENTPQTPFFPFVSSQEAPRSILDDYVTRGAEKMVQDVLEAEVRTYIEQHDHITDDHGHRIVVRNGYLPERTILTPAGRLKIRKPRIDDRRDGERFTSAILLPYQRRSPAMNALIPALYLKGISTGDFSSALEAITGTNPSDLSATTIVRLKQTWSGELEEWNRRNLSGKQYVYMWADGVYFNVRLGGDRPCFLVIIGASADGKKELIGLLDGERESTLSWKSLLLDLKNRGVPCAPALAVGDGALGFWAALAEVYGETRQQRCWVHKTTNVMKKLPKTLQETAKKDLQEMYLAPTKAAALHAFDQFLQEYGVDHPKACACLVKDKDQLFTFYDFPAEHWCHLRTSNPIESTFATIRLRTYKTKGCGSRDATNILVYKLAREAEKGWQELNGAALVHRVEKGFRFADGIEIQLAA